MQRRDLRLPAFALLALSSASSAQSTPPHAAGSAQPEQRLARRAQLAGESLPVFPDFVRRRTFQETEPIEVAVDPDQFPDVVGKTAGIFVVAARTPGEWAADRTLVDVTGAVETVVLGPTLAANVVVADAGTLPSGGGVELAAGFDVVVDLDGDGLLSAPDLIDGLGAEPGLFVARDPSLPGPFAVTEVDYALPGPFHAQALYFPSTIAALGELPVVFVAHGNGQSYLGFDDLGTHLASHGFVVVAHQVNTTPGPAVAAVSIVENTDLFLASHADLAGGVLAGHVDESRLAWIGLRRGGEAAVFAHAGVVDGAFSPVAFGAEDVRALVAISPSDLLGSSLDPGGAAFTLVEGSATPGECPIHEPFRILDRGGGPRRSLHVQGAAAGDHYPSGATGAGSGVGPCPTGPADVQALARGYLVPLLAHDVRGELAGRDFLARPWAAFHPLAAPSGPCVEVELSYRAGAGEGRLVIDDFQSAPSLSVSSSGAPVATDLLDLVEDFLDDPDFDLSHVPGQPMNAMTYAGPGDDSRGAVLSFTDDRFLAFDLPGAPRDVRDHSVLSLRACQRSRHPLTETLLAPLDFTIELEDAGGAASAVALSALGAELAVPYQRDGCGVGLGWINVFETVRVPLASFRGIDRSAVVRVRLRFGPSHGSPVGALGLDDLELLADG